MVIAVYRYPSKINMGLVDSLGVMLALRSHLHQRRANYNQPTQSTQASALDGIGVGPTLAIE